jgi:Uma2 family endonuclease
VGAASPPRSANAAPDIAARRLRTWGPLYIACFGGLYLTLHFQQVNLLLLLCLWPFWRALRTTSAASPIGSRRVDKRSAVHPSRGWISRRSSTLLHLPFNACCRHVAAGACLALGSIAKPHYGLLLLGVFGCLRVGRRPGPGVWLVLGAALAGAALLWLSLIITPSGSWAAWWEQVPGTTSYTTLPPGHSSIAAPWNRSIAGEVARWLVPNKFIAPVIASPEAAQWVTTALVLALGLATAWAVLGSLRRRARRCAAGRRSPDPVVVDLELSLIAVWVFLAAPASWTHHLVMLLPAALVLLREAVLDPRAGGLGRIAAVLVLAVLALTLDDLIPREVRTGSRAIMALMTVAVLGLWALLLQRLLAQHADHRNRSGGRAKHEVRPKHPGIRNRVLRRVPSSESARAPIRPLVLRGWRADARSTTAASRQQNASQPPTRGSAMSVTARSPGRASSLGTVVRLSVADYLRMGEAGILGPELRTELIDGEVVETPPSGHPHAGPVKLLSNLLKEQVGARAIVSVQDPVWLDDYTEPLPDIALLRPRADYYRNGHPAPDDVLLLIEVADTSLAYDRDVKLPRYARAGIPEAWLVDLGGRRLTIYRRPAGCAYAETIAASDLRALVVPLAGDEGPTALALDLTGLFRTSQNA